MCALVTGVQAGAIPISYRDRKVKKRSFRALWIQRINAGVRAEGLTYSQFMHGLKLAGVELDRKVLADIAMHEAEAFSAIVAQAKAALDRKSVGSGKSVSVRVDLGRRRILIKQT